MSLADAPRPGRHGGVIGSRAGRPVFVKRATGEASARELAREAATLRALASAPGVAAAVPGVVAEEVGALVLEVVPGRDLQARLEAGLPPGARVGAAVGRAVAALHVGAAGLVGDAQDAVRSAAFEAPRPDAVLLRLLSAAGIDLLRALQGSQDLCDLLDQVGRERARDTLVHGDLRFANVMLEGDAVRLVDWEFAGRGDARDDLGAFVGSCLEAWLSSVPAVPGVAPEHLVGLAACPLETVTPAINAFLGAYAHARGFDGPAEEAMRVSALRFAAARLVHLAFEVASETEDLRMDHVLRLQVAANILTDPGGAGERLLADPRAHVA